MAHDLSCPVCGRTLEGAETPRVCDGCFEAVEAIAAQRVQSTGEFTAVTPQRAAELLRGDAAPDPPAGRQGVPSCSWCNKLRDQVKKLLSQGSVCICNECVALCAEILEVELGDGWRK